MREAIPKTVSGSQALIQSAEKYFPNGGGSFEEEKKKLLEIHFKGLESLNIREKRHRE